MHAGVVGCVGSANPRLVDGKLGGEFGYLFADALFGGGIAHVGEDVGDPVIVGVRVIVGVGVTVGVRVGVRLGPKVTVGIEVLVLAGVFVAVGAPQVGCGVGVWKTHCAVTVTKWPSLFCVRLGSPG